MADAVAKAADVPRADVRRALMLRGDLGAVAAARSTDGAAGLRGDRARAAAARCSRCSPRPAPTSPPRSSAISPAAVEFKLDGARVQVHRRGDEVRVFTRSLDDITARVPEVVAGGARAAAPTAAVLDGEAIALRADGRPEPFQVTASRMGSRRPRRRAPPLTALFFDVLHVDGEDLLDRPGAERFEALAALVPGGAARAAGGHRGRRAAPRRCSPTRSPAATRA